MNPEEAEGRDRRRYMGGSDCAAALGYSKWETPYEVFVEKTSTEPGRGLPPDKLRFLNRRKRWEGVVVQMLREELKADVVALNQVYVDGDLEFLACEIDYEFGIDTETAGVLKMDPSFIGSIQSGEIKSVSPRAWGERFGWGEPGTSDVPIEYEAQCQHGLGIKDRQVCLLTAMVGLDDMLFYPLLRNDEVIGVIRAGLAKFWNENVLTLTAPEAKTIEDLNKMFVEPVVGKSVTADHPMGVQALQLRAIRSKMESLSLEAERIEFEVKNFMKDAEALIVDGEKLVNWKWQKWSDLDEASLKEEEKAIYKKYTIGGRRRVFSPLKGWKPTT